jgi:macrodomain Ter protein organizer (MatP/YcbG family)
MPRPLYTITGPDKRFVVAYLERRLREPGYLKHLEAPAAARATRAFAEARGTIEELNAWAERYLDTSRWRPLKDAVRQQRRRATFPDLKTVTLTTQAWIYLSDLSARDQVTLSQVVERYLYKPWSKGR